MNITILVRGIKHHNMLNNKTTGGQKLAEEYNSYDGSIQVPQGAV